MSRRYLVLANGEVFAGEAFGAPAAPGGTVGELVFTTGMNGYIETLTDPSYCGQIVLQTFPLIGNYGVMAADCEGRCALRGYVVREWCEQPSNFRCEETVEAFLRENGVPGLCGVDTRAITRILREAGVMNARLCDTPTAADEALRQFRITGAVNSVSTAAPAVYPATGEQRFRVALIDYGAKRNIVRELCRRGCRVTVFPYNVKAAEILHGGFDGVMLSNGPGDPAENTGAIAEIGRLFGRLPIFGICLGHQLLALACGGRTIKLKYGHRGTNQPAVQTATGRTFITSQNHGYAVVPDSVPGGVESYRNGNDGTCEGMVYPEAGAFSVQFHPEACSGPHDTAFLFDEFCALMEAPHTQKGGADHAAR